MEVVVIEKVVELVKVAVFAQAGQAVAVSVFEW